MNLLKFINSSSVVKHTPQQKFIRASSFVLDDEEIADSATKAMLLVMNNHQRSATNTKTLRIEDYAPLVDYGVRFPWKDRITLLGQIDTVNDEIPYNAVVHMPSPARGIYASAVYAQKVQAGFAKKHRALSGVSHVFRVGMYLGYESLSKSVVADSKGEMETIVQPAFAGIFPDGTCVGCSLNGVPSMYPALLLSYVVGLHNDRRYFWEVQATEEFWENYPARAMFSIDEEYIKSLFYARSVPLTNSGRLRPILHWVKAHKRRLKEGVDIDINKHMRGIDSFVMHDVRFSITQPRKKREEG